MVTAVRITSTTVCKGLVTVTGGAAVNFLHLIAIVFMVRKTAMVLRRDHLGALAANIIHVLFERILYLIILSALATAPMLLV